MHIERHGLRIGLIELWIGHIWIQRITIIVCLERGYGNIHVDIGCIVRCMNDLECIIFRFCQTHDTCRIRIEIIVVICCSFIGNVNFQNIIVIVCCVDIGAICFCDLYPIDIASIIEFDSDITVSFRMISSICTIIICLVFR